MPIRFSVRFAYTFSVVLLTFGVVVTSPRSLSAQGTAQWERDLQGDLIAEKFDGLDATADQLRSGKTRLPGGQWQLRVFYSALDAPQQSEQDSAEHIAHLEHWMSQRPNSITARVALATALTRWAWVARGHGYANTVTPEGWRLFRERIDQAQIVLEGSQKMQIMCPQWYSAMLTVGTAQGWDLERMHQVLEEGVKFEPGYYYLSQQYANYLLPKWHGRSGDASSFARTSADAIGGDAGDILYFQVATELIKRGDDEFPAHEMDWQRIQRGYQALFSQYGSAHFPQNQLAYMAWKFQDANVARQQFEVIGSSWNRNVWGNRDYFDRARDWAQSPTASLLPGQGQLQPAAIH
jgi:hypothetical protein